MNTKRGGRSADDAVARVIAELEKLIATWKPDRGNSATPLVGELETLVSRLKREYDL